MDFSQRLTTGKLAWYVLLVRAGKEVDVRDKIYRNKDLFEVEEMVVPEPTTFSEEERYKILLGYVFLKFKLSLPVYHNILGLDAVYRFLGKVYTTNTEYYYSPCHIPEHQINNVKTFLSGDAVSQEKKQLEFSIGSEVQIVEGDLTSIRGTVVSLTGQYVNIMPKTFFTQVIKVPLSKVACCKD